MFIDSDWHKRTRAPEERNVVSEEASRNIPPYRSGEHSMGLVGYKRFVPPGLRIVPVAEFLQSRGAN
jgi:hypothetical protein